MQRPKFLIFAVLVASTASVQAQSILGTITTPDKAVATVNQTLVGTWLIELHRPGAPATQPPILNLSTFQPDGTQISSAADGTQSVNHGVWVRVGDRRFLGTTFIFNFDAARALTTIVKVRINSLVSLDGQTTKGTAEAIVMDPTGKVLATLPGGTFTGVRLSPEIPADFYDFQKVQ